MKKTFFRLFIFFTANCCCQLPTELFATHNRAGEITYKWISGSKYEITVTTYTRTQSYSADRCEILINYGDGSSLDTIERINGNPCLSPNPPCDYCGEILPNDPDVKKNIYRVEHVFPGNGGYFISVDNPNRGEILNIPNSVNTSFYIESTLVITTLSANNSSPFFNFPAVGFGATNSTNFFDNSAQDIDGDSLVYSLMPSLGAAGSLIPGYVFPNDNSLCPSPFEFNSLTGIITWCSPCWSGFPNNDALYSVGILVEEYRSGIKIGSILRDFQIIIDSIGDSDTLCMVSNHQVQKENFSVDVFPNPFNETTTFSINNFLETDHYNIEVYDLFGKKIMKQEISSPQQKFNFQFINQGCYFYNLFSNNSLKQTGKLFVQ